MTHRVLFVGNFLSASGTHRLYVEDLSDRLEQQRWSIIRTSSRVGRFAKLGDMLNTCWRRRHDFDVAHVDVFSGAAFIWAEATCALLRGLHKPIVLTLRGGNLPSFAHRWPRRVRSLLRGASLVTAPSRFLESHLADFSKSIEVIPNAIDASRYAFRERVPLAPRLVWLRAFHEVYNPVMAVDVVAALRRRHHDASLTMIGADKGDGSLHRARARASELGVASSISFVPGIPKRQVPSALASADVFLNTTNVDNTPVSVLEAMASGLFVVSTNAGGMPYLVDDGTNALLVPPGSIDAMTEAIERGMQDPSLARRVEHAARATAMLHDWSHILERWEQMVSRVSDHA